MQPPSPYGGFSAWIGTNSAPGRKPREEFMFGSEPIIAYRVWNVGTATYDSLGDFLGLLADAHDAGADNPYRWAQQRTKRSLLLPVGAGPLAGGWVPGVNEAKCIHGEKSGHKAPHLNCECGFWALRDELQLLPTFNHYTPAAWGKVKLWGRYCEFEKGYRAQYATPAEITLLRGDEQLAADLSRTYGCPVTAGKEPQAVIDARTNALEGLQINPGSRLAVHSPLWIRQNVGLSGMSATMLYRASAPRAPWWKRG